MPKRLRPHSTNATFASPRDEKVVEQLFVGELLRLFWILNAEVQVLRPEVDAAGYDIVLTKGRLICLRPEADVRQRLSTKFPEEAKLAGTEGPRHTRQGRASACSTPQ